MAERRLPVGSAAMTERGGRGRSQAYLPDYVISIIISEFVEDPNLIKCLELRLVNRYFNSEVLYQLFTQFRINPKVQNLAPSRRYNIHDVTVWRYWNAFITSNAPLKSFSRDNLSFGFNNPAIPKQSRRLKTLHNTLNEAVDITSRHKGDKCYSSKPSEHNLCASDSTVAKVPRDHHVSDLCNAAIHFLGPEFAWQFIHPQTSESAYSTLHGIRGSNDEMAMRSFYDQHLINKPARFWACLATAYCGNLKRLQTQLDSFKVPHKNTTRWLERLDTTYVDFCHHSNAPERRWLEVLAACLAISVSSDKPDTIDFILKQDEATSSRAFVSIQFSGRNTLETAVRSRRLWVLNTLIENRWLLNSTDEILDSDQYRAALVAVADIPASDEDRTDMLRRLFDMNKGGPPLDCYQVLLNKIARDNNMLLAETVLSLISDRYTIQDSLAQVPYREQENPITIAIREGHMGLARLFLQHSEVFLLHQILTRSDGVYHFQTDALVELLKTQNQPDPDMVRGLLEPCTRPMYEEQVKVLVHQMDRIPLLETYFQHVDISHKLSADDTTTIGDFALSHAIVQNRHACAVWLVEQRDVTFTFESPSDTIPLPIVRSPYAPYATYWDPDGDDHLERYLIRELMWKQKVVINHDCTRLRRMKPDDPDEYIRGAWRDQLYTSF